MELNELRKTAESATPGPWAAETHGAYTDDKYHAVYSVESGDHSVISQLGCGCCDVGLEVSKPDTAFVTTFNPETVLALLSRLEQAEQAVQRVLAMAQDWEANGNSCAVGDRSADVWQATANAILRALDGDGRA